MPPKKTQTQSKLTDFGKKTERSEDVIIDVDADKVTKKGRAEVPTPAVVTSESGKIDLLSLITDPDWKAALTPVINGPLGQKIAKFLYDEIHVYKKEIFPPTNEIFAALNVLPLKDVKVVLIGQDPYHDNNQAHGLAFSVKGGVKPPPSLVNMYKELATDIEGFKIPPHGHLMKWAKEGILMLNATLTVVAHNANSHAKCGWQEFTDEIIKIINKERENVVFLLWGGFAQKKGKIIDTKKHKIVACAHPSPLSAKHWFGSKTFSKCNEALIALGKTPVDWHLPATPE